MPKIFEVGDKVYCVQFKGAQIIGSHDEIEELCLALEEFLYDEPTYSQLQGEASELRHKLDQMEGQVEMLEWSLWEGNKMRVRYVTAEKYIQEQRDLLESEKEYLAVVPGEQTRQRCLQVIKEYEEYIEHLEAGGCISTFKCKYIGGGSVA